MTPIVKVDPFEVETISVVATMDFIRRMKAAAEGNDVSLNRWMLIAFSTDLELDEAEHLFKDKDTGRHYSSRCYDLNSDDPLVKVECGPLFTNTSPDPAEVLLIGRALESVAIEFNAEAVERWTRLAHAEGMCVEDFISRLLNASAAGQERATASMKLVPYTVMVPEHYAVFMRTMGEIAPGFELEAPIAFVDEQVLADKEFNFRNAIGWVTEGWEFDDQAKSERLMLEACQRLVTSHEAATKQEEVAP